MFLLGAVGARLAMVRSRSKGLVNSLTGLPNLAALAADKQRPGTAVGRRARPQLCRDRLDPRCRRRAPVHRADRRPPDPGPAGPPNLPGRRGHLRLVRRQGHALRLAPRRPARLVPQPGPGRRDQHRRGAELRRRTRQQPLADQPAGQRPGRRRRRRFRIAQVEIPRSGAAGGCSLAAVAAVAARQGDRQWRGLARLPAQARPGDAADDRRRGAGPLDPPRKGPDQPHRVRLGGRAA